MEFHHQTQSVRFSRVLMLLFLLTAVACCLPEAVAQFGGGGLGGGGFSSGSSSPGDFWGSKVNGNAAKFQSGSYRSLDQTLNAIQIHGSAQKRLTPEEIRLVIALTSLAETPDECQAALKKQIEATRKTWKENLQITDQDIAEDFISLLPVHPIQGSLGSRRIDVKPDSFRLQINLHLAVKTDQEAKTAIELALKAGSANVVTLDYWHSKIDEAKKAVLAEALKEAKEKSKVLLSVFDKTPAIINVDEVTRAYSPTDLYQTYSNLLLYDVNSLGNQPSDVGRLSFLRGLLQDPDSRPDTMLMRPEIVIASQVTLSYQSPAKTKVEINTGPGGFGGR